MVHKFSPGILGLKLYTWKTRSDKQRIFHKDGSATQIWDSAFKLNGCGKFVHLPYGQIGYVDRIPVPRMNNYTYLPQEPPLFLLIDLSLISGEQDNGMFAIIIAVVLIGPNVSKFKKNCPRRNSRPNQH